jgi:hypothetical protein
VIIAISDTARWVNHSTSIHAVAGGAPRHICLPPALRR